MELNPNLDLSDTAYHQWKVAEDLAFRECAPWTKAINNLGYGISWRDGKTISAHRKVYEEHYGQIPKGLVVRHTCDNRSCVNPKHLVLGTHKQNSQDMVERNRQAKGNKIGTSVLTDDLVRMIKSMSGSSRKLAKFFGCSATTIKDIKNNKIWKHIT